MTVNADEKNCTGLLLHRLLKSRGMKTTPQFLAVSLALTLAACADVQESSHIVGGRTGTPLTVSVGDTANLNLHHGFAVSHTEYSSQQAAGLD